MIDIVNTFKTQYDQRILLAGLVNPRNKPLDQGVKVEQIVSYDRSSTIRRLYTWSWSFLQILFLVKWKYRDAHLFLVSNPPLATLLPLFCSNSYSLLIYDIYPDTLVEYRILKRTSFLAKLWQWGNKKVFSKAQQIFTITESMKNRLCQYTIDQQKIRVVPVWTDNSFFKPIDKPENPFLAKLGLADRFIVLYSGNLGHTHQVEILIELARKTTREELYFLIIGEGEKEKLIREKIVAYGLKNCRLLPWQPTEVLPYSLSAADLAVVSLGRQASKLSIPSKTYNFLSVGAPIMGISDPGSELSQLIKRHRVGANFSEEELESMLFFIEEVLDNPAQQLELKENASLASKAYGPENAKLFLEGAFTS